MQFCLRCMERTDGVLEIRQKRNPRCLPVIGGLAAAAAAVLLFWGLMRMYHENDPAPSVMTGEETAPTDLQGTESAAPGDHPGD